MPDAPSTPVGDEPTSGSARRSDRISIAVPIELTGTDSAGKSFSEKARTVLIGCYGALIRVNRPLASGQELGIRCLGTGRETKCHVVSQLGSSPEGHLYGLEMPDPNANLWEIDFPPATESEMAAARMLLECKRCGKCAVSYLTIGEVEIFHKNRCVSRACEHCSDMTVWNEASLRNLLIEPATLPVDPLIGEPALSVPQRTEDERVDPRINLNLTGCVRSPRHGEDIVETENVSEGGVCFKSGNRYAGGEIVGVAIPYMQDAANVFAQARITWARFRPADGVTSYGLAYLHARRRARRVKPKTPITIGFIGSGVRSSGKIVDLSLTGVLVRCPEQLEPGTVVRMGVEMGHETIRLAATAKRCVPDVGTAFAFTQMSHRDRSLLRRLILRIEKQWPY